MLNFFITRNGGCFSICKVEGLSNGIANGPSNGLTRKSLNDIAKKLSNNVIAIITMAIDNSMNGNAKVLTYDLKENSSIGMELSNASAKTCICF